MARKETVTKQMIGEAAFKLLRTQGTESVSARKLAASLGCSSQPIFRVYRNMSELIEEMFAQAIQTFGSHYMAFGSKDASPFVDLGLAYIDFAVKEPHLFSLLFLSVDKHGKSMYEFLNGTTGAVNKEINKLKAQGVKAPLDVFMKMWVLIHGVACMSLTGDYDLGEAETTALLKESYQAYAGL
jgi:AcrR family transcriptional regulator